MKQFVLVLSLTLISSTVFSQTLPIQDTSKVVKVKKKILEAYVGHFQMDGMALKVEFTLEGNQLYANVAGMGKMALIPGSNTAFQAKDIQAQVEFVPVKGKVQKLKFYQGGSVIEGSRIEAPKELQYERIPVGNVKIDYDKIFTPFNAEWDLIINGRKVGTASTHLRHAVYEGQPAYHGGSVIRYEAMGNKPFADVGIFSKKDHRLLWARNAVSQEDEITSSINGNTFERINLKINTGEITEQNSYEFSEPVNGGHLYSLLAIGVEQGKTVQFPISGLNKVSWAKMHVVGKEQVKIEALDKTFDAWKIEYASGTIRWIIEEAPYLVKWQMPTGMIWELKSYVK